MSHEQEQLPTLPPSSQYLIQHHYRTHIERKRIEKRAKEREREEKKKTENEREEEEERDAF